MDLSRETLDREFPSRSAAVQLNHAAVCPLPRVAAEAMAAYARRLATHGGLDWKAWGAEAARLRALAARLVGAGERTGGAASISIVPNTTWGLNLVAGGLDWKPGDAVVTTATEFPANLTPWLALARQGVEVRRVPTRDGAFTAGDVAALCDARTRLVSVSAVSFFSGFPAPVAEIAAFCRPRGIVFGVDGIQAAGAFPLSVEEWDVDFLSADGHKWMLGPEGCGILYTRPDFRARLRAPGGWTNLPGTRRGDYRVPETPEFVEDGTRFEVGALATPGVYALAASLELLLSIGLENAAARNAAAVAALVEELPRAGWSPVLFDGVPRTAILAARPPDGVVAHAVARALEGRGFVVSARQGFLRFSPHVSVEADEARAAARALRSL